MEVETEKAEYKKAKKAEKITCKICHCEEETEDDPLMTPCLCKGTMKHIHNDCLSEWIKSSNNSYCDICKYPYKFKKIFQNGTPENIPVTCIIKSIWKVCLGYLGRCTRIGYFIFKNIILIYLNRSSAISILNIKNKLDVITVLFLCSISVLLNLMHSYFLRIIYNLSKNNRTIRMNSRSTLENMTSDIVSRTGSTISNIQVHDGNSMEENSSIDSLDISTTPFINISINVPSIACIKKDSLQIVSLTWFTIILSVILKVFDSLFNGIFIGILNAFNSTFYNISNRILNNSIIKQLIPHKLSISTWELFLRSTNISPSVHSFIGLTLFISISCTTLHCIKRYFNNFYIRVSYNYIKAYVFTILATIYAFLFMGIIMNFAFIVFINRGIPVASISNSAYSFILHVIIGFSYCKFYKNSKDKLGKLFRPGFYNNYVKDNNIASIAKYAIETPFSKLLSLVVFNFLLLASSIIILMYPFSFMKIPFIFNIQVSDLSNHASSLNIKTIIYCKMLVMLVHCIDQFILLLCMFYAFIIRKFSAYFNMENYLFGKKILKFDRKYLVWDLNVKRWDDVYNKQLVKINKVINENKRKSDNSKKNNDKLTDKSTNDKTTGNKTTDNKINNKSTSKKNEEIFKILNKFTITDQRIEKYFGNEHKGRFSIFYKPKFYTLYKIIISLLCIGVCLSIVYALCKISLFVSVLNLGFDRDCLFLVTFVLLFRIISVFNYLSDNSISAFINMLAKFAVIYFYTNILFPLAISLSFFIGYYNSPMFVSFFKIFAVMNSISLLVFTCYKIFSLATIIESYSFTYMIASLIAFAICKVVLVLMYFVYVNYIGLKFAISGLTITVFVINGFYILKFILTGNILEKIKDDNYLERKVILNYEE